MDKRIVIIIDNTFEIKKKFFEEFAYLKNCFGKIYILHIKFTNNKFNKDFNKSELVNKNYLYYEANSYQEIKIFLDLKKSIILNYINRSIKNHKIFRILKKSKVIQILISDTGYVADNNIYNKNNYFKNLKNFFYFKTNYFFFRIFVIIGLYPSYNLYLESSMDIIKKIKRGISSKIDLFFGTNFFSFYKKIVHINSKFINYSKKKKIFKKQNNKIITFIETPLNHPDRIEREGPMNAELEKKYYYQLINFFKIIKKTYKKEIIICAHPFSNIKETKKKFKEFVVVQNQTSKFIQKSYIVIFHQSSSIVEAIYQKKKIINLRSNLMGYFLNYRNKLYSKYINLLTIQLKNKYKINKKNMILKLQKNIFTYSKYIKNNIASNKNISHDDQICQEIKKISKYIQ